MVTHPKVLIANTDPGILRLLRRHLGNAGYTVSTADKGRSVLDLLRLGPPDVIILSTDMGDLQGVDLVRSVHAVTDRPLLALIPVNRSIARSTILNAGADDCLDEPFRLDELIAMTRQLLDRAGTHPGPKVLMTCHGKLEISSLDRSVSLRGRTLRLTRRQFDLLAVLARANGATVSHDEILSGVWGGTDDSALQNMRRVIGDLRRKIEPGAEPPNVLVSLRGRGYRLNVEE